jgi:hypothetical protein
LLYRVQSQLPHGLALWQGHLRAKGSVLISASWRIASVHHGNKRVPAVSGHRLFDHTGESFDHTGESNVRGRCRSGTKISARNSRQQLNFNTARGTPPAAGRTKANEGQANSGKQLAPLSAGRPISLAAKTDAEVGRQSSVSAVKSQRYVRAISDRLGPGDRA